MDFSSFPDTNITPIYNTMAWFDIPIYVCICISIWSPDLYIFEFYETKFFLLQYYTVAIMYTFFPNATYTNKSYI